MTKTRQAPLKRVPKAKGPAASPMGAGILGGKWTMGGGPEAHGSRPLGNWQSDRAYDLMAPAGTPVYAPADSVVAKARFSDNGRTVWGYQVTLAGSGNQFFLTHLGKIAVKPGQSVRRGQLIGFLGAPPYFPSHLHIGLQSGELSDYL